MVVDNGYDAINNGWSRYDPYYHDVEPKGKFDTITCINVLSAVSAKIRGDIIDNIKNLLADNGNAYLVVPRNLPIGGKYSGYNRRPQTHVVLTLESVYKDKSLEIYRLRKNSDYKDKTINLGS
jgi:hypothetical protein